METTVQREYIPFTQPYISVIEKYVSATIRQEYRPFLKDHVGEISKRIEKIVLETFTEIKAIARKRLPTDADRYEATVHKILDKDLSSIIVAILEREFQFKCTSKQGNSASGGSIGRDIVRCNGFDFEIYCTWSPINKFIYGQKAAGRRPPLVSINNTLKKLYEETQEETFKGIKLISAEGKEFKVHKAVLRLGNTFDNMLSVAMLEKKAKTVVLQDVTAKVLENFILFLYDKPFSFNPREDVSTLVGLYKLAHLYGQRDLFITCTYYLENWVGNKKITIENFKKIFLLGTLYENEFLVGKCLETAEKCELFKEFLLKLVNNKNIAIVHFVAKKRGNIQFANFLEKKMYEICERNLEVQ